MIRDRKWAEKKAKELVAKMSIEEKASQLRFDAPSIDRLNINEYNWWNEGLHGLARAGVATMFPQAIALAAMFDRDMMEKIADVISTEARAKYNTSVEYGDRDIYKGLTIWSPNINIFRDPRWGRGHETYGEDPYLTGELGSAFVKGLQGDSKYLKTAACAKHFAVHSGPEKDRHHFNAEVSDKDLWETYLPAFEKLVEKAQVESVMGAYNRTNGEPCCGSNFLIKEVLRKKWDFKGHFVSDCWAVRDFHQHHKITANAEESVALALKSGCDVNCGCTYQYVMSAIEKGMISEEDVSSAAERLFTTRFLLGEFEDNPYNSIGYDEIESKEHVELSIESAIKSSVLLKNDGILPLDKNKVKSIAVIGPNANSRAALIANYHGTSSRYITLLEGIQDEVADTDIKVNYSIGCHLSRNRVEDLAKPDDRLSEARAAAYNSDLVILSLGLDESLEGEEGDDGNSYCSGDKDDISLPQSQLRLLDAMIDTGVPIILVLQAGSCIDLTKADSSVNAILDAWYPGARGGKAIADLLFGKRSPSGKLPITFYNTLDKMPKFEDYSMSGRTYRYADSDTILYPFGFGLTYNQLELKNVCIKKIDNNHNYEAKVCVKNNGNFVQDEVVQIYLKDESKEGVKNYKLVAFEHVSVESKSDKTFDIVIPSTSFEAIDENGNKGIFNNKFSLSIGFSQCDEKSISLMGIEPVKVEIEL
jgi:beta-glucosidase